jgi:hypothetical protein
MSVTNGSITTPLAAQFLSSPLPSSATITCAFANLSGDILIVAFDGLAASPTHGIVVNAGSTVDFFSFIKQLAAFGGLGGFSVFGPVANAPFSITSL